MSWSDGFGASAGGSGDGGGGVGGAEDLRGPLARLTRPGDSAGALGRIGLRFWFRRGRLRTRPGGGRDDGRRQRRPRNRRGAGRRGLRRRRGGRRRAVRGVSALGAGFSALEEVFAGSVVLGGATCAAGAGGATGFGAARTGVEGRAGGAGSRDRSGGLGGAGSGAANDRFPAQVPLRRPAQTLRPEAEPAPRAPAGWRPASARARDSRVAESAPEARSPQRRPAGPAAVSQAQPPYRAVAPWPPPPRG